MLQTQANHSSFLKTLRARKEFLCVQAAGRKWVSGSVIVETCPWPSAPENIFFGITVSKRISKSAVVRNRVRRRLRAAATDVLANRKERGIAYVLVGRHGTVDCDYETLKKDLGWCLHRLEKQALEKQEPEKQGNVS